MSLLGSGMFLLGLVFLNSITGHLLMTKRVNLAFRIVPEGTHCEASWAKQVPIFMECLGV